MKKAYIAAKEEKASTKETQTDRSEGKERKVIFYTPSFEILAIEESTTDTQLDK